MYCRTFQSSRGGCEGFARHKKRAGEVSVYFELEMNAVGFEMFPQIKISFIQYSVWRQVQNLFQNDSAT
jgi:hypothetical protein